MSIRYARVTHRSCARYRTTSFQGNKRPCAEHKWSSFPATTSLVLQPLSNVLRPLAFLAHRRVFSSTSGQRDGGSHGDAEGLNLQEARTKAEDPSFPWRGAPKLMVQPESFITKVFLGLVFDDSSLVGEDLRVGAEAAFVCAAGAFFKMPPSEVVLSPEPESTGDENGEVEAQTKHTAPTAGEKENSSAEDDPTSPAEEESNRVLDAIDDRLVTFSSEKGAAVRASGAVPHFRLHKVVAAAVSRRAFVVGAERGDEISDHLKRAITPSWVVIVDMEKTSAEFERAMAGQMCVVLHVDVDLACDETFYVTDENGKVVQGTKERVGRIHRLRLESNIGSPEEPKPPRWKVIDLDNWLEGNSFW